MGLFSDYLEECRSRYSSGLIDPCMLIDSKTDSKSCSQIYKKLNELADPDLNSDHHTQLQMELIKNLEELEQLKSAYLISEKLIYEIINQKNPNSMLVQDILNALKRQFRQSYLQICELRNKINEKVDPQRISASLSTPEQSIRLNILERIIKSILLYMKNGVISSTSECRKVVSDCANIIRCLEQENYIRSDKDVFSYYLEKTFFIKKSRYRCSNCGRLLHEDIPYCLNCYERNI